MTVLYKMCFNADRKDDEQSHPGPRPCTNNIYDIVRVCLLSLMKQMSDEDNIVFFLDGIKFILSIIAVLLKLIMNVYCILLTTYKMIMR